MARVLNDRQMKFHAFPIALTLASTERGCVVLDQPQRVGGWAVLRLVCDKAALRFMVREQQKTIS